MCTQRRLRSAWTSTQSDQSLRCLHEESLGPPLPIECTVETLSDWADAEVDPSLRLAQMSFCWFCHEAAQII